MRKQVGPRDRILETASRLFYKQGYNNTGINQILDEAQVAKASLYQHFGSKEEVAVEYLRVARLEWFEGLADWINRKGSALQKVYGCFDFLEYAVKSSGYRGCNFMNMLSEIADTSPSLQKQILDHKATLREYIRSLVRDVPREKPLNTEMIGDSIYLLFEGAIVESKIFKDSWPIRSAKKAAKALLE